MIFSWNFIKIRKKFNGFFKFSIQTPLGLAGIRVTNPSWPNVNQGGNKWMEELATGFHPNFFESFMNSKVVGSEFRLLFSLDGGKWLSERLRPLISAEFLYISKNSIEFHMNYKTFWPWIPIIYFLSSLNDKKFTQYLPLNLPAYSAGNHNSQHSIVYWHFEHNLMILLTEQKLLCQLCSRSYRIQIKYPLNGIINCIGN